MAQSGQPPLVGIKVLDLSRIIAGPLCCQQMADMGADVLKVENPKTGDDSRSATKPWAGQDSHFFQAFNRNKRSIGLDFREGEGKEIFFKLLGEADVLVENFRPGVMSRYGLDYASLKERFPRLVYCSVSAYGETGSLSDRPGFDPVLQAESGLMSMTGEPDGPPLRHPVSIIDIMTALHSVGAIMAALWARQDIGTGQHIELALMDVAVAALSNAGQAYLLSGEQPKRSGNSHPLSTPTNLFHAKDGDLYMACASDRLFGKFCREVIDRPDLPEDPRFDTTSHRFENRPALFEILNGIFATKTRAEWLAKMRHLPAGALQNFDESLNSEIVHERRMVREVEHPLAGPIKLFGSPLNFSDTPVREFVAAPLLGADTEDVMHGIGYDDGQIAALREAGVIH
jgi:succinate--hydroxymethylglutarate CoA-transferase